MWRGAVDVKMYGAIWSTNTGAVQGRGGGHIREGRTQTNLSLGLFGNQRGDTVTIFYFGDLWYKILLLNQEHFPGAIWIVCKCANGNN